MKVYVVTQTEYDRCGERYTSIVDIFDSREKADKLANPTRVITRGKNKGKVVPVTNRWEYMDIEEWEVK